MQEQQRTYIAIDLKSFYASVECVDRGIDPLTTNIVEPRSQDFQSCAYTKSAKVQMSLPQMDSNHHLQIQNLTC